MRYLFPVILLASCGWSEERFLTVGLDEWCTTAADCEGGYTAEDCIDHIRTVDRSSCEFDAAAADACIEGLETATCTPLPALGTSTFDSPSDCDEVWAGCGPLFPRPIAPGTSPPEPEP